jgi:hypothetical protein
VTLSTLACRGDTGTDVNWWSGRLDQRNLELEGTSVELATPFANQGTSSRIERQADKDTQNNRLITSCGLGEFRDRCASVSRRGWELEGKYPALKTRLMRNSRSVSPRRKASVIARILGKLGGGLQITGACNPNQGLAVPLSSADAL